MKPNVQCSKGCLADEHGSQSHAKGFSRSGQPNGAKFLLSRNSHSSTLPIEVFNFDRSSKDPESLNFPRIIIFEEPLTWSPQSRSVRVTSDFNLTANDSLTLSRLPEQNNTRHARALCWDTRMGWGLGTPPRAAFPRQF